MSNDTSGRPFLALALALALALPFKAEAQIPTRITLEDAQRTALVRNPAYLKALNDLDVDAAEERARMGAFLPELSTSFSLRGSSSRTITGQDNFGQPIRRDDPLSYRNSSSSQGISAGLVLFDGFANVNRLRAAREDSRAGVARLRSEAARLRTLVAQRYYAVQRARLAIALEERLLASAKERLDAVQRLLAVAAQSPVDVLGARVDVASQEQALARARGEARKVELELLEVLGMPMDGAVELADPLPDVFDPAALDGDAILAQVLRASPRLEALDAGVAAAERGSGVARGARWPTLRLTGGFDRGMSLSSYEALHELNPQNRSVSFGLSVSLPVFRGFATSAQVAAAEAREQDAREDARAGRLQLERELRASLIDLGNAYQQHVLAERSAELSRQRVEMAQEQYRQGALGFTELQNVIDRAARAEREALDARVGFAGAVVVLEERAGTEIRP